MALSAEEGNRLVGLLTEHAERITEGWTDRVTASMRNRLSRAELHQQVQEVHRGLLLLGEDPTFDQAGEHGAELRAVLSELSRLRARQGFTATETALSILSLKDTLADAPRRQRPGSPAVLPARSRRSSTSSALYTFESYAKAREELIADQAEQLLELSTPVVKLWEGVVAVPLVGTLDSARAQVVMERLLQTLVDTGSPYAIIDITGVPAVDTQVAQHILKTVVAARLMGADCIISGIRPQIAQTIVALGIEFGDIVTKATLADALLHVLRQTGRRVRPAPIAPGRPDGPRSGPEDRRHPARLHPGRPEDQTAAAAAGGPGRPDRRHRRHGVIIDITALDIVDSFIGRMLSTIASISRVLDAETVVVGMRPAVAITLVELGLSLNGIRTALNVERGLELLAAARSDESGLRADEDEGRGRTVGDRRRDRRARPRPVADAADRQRRGRGPGPAAGAYASPSRRSSPWSTRPSWSPPPASWPATPWSTAAAATVRGEHSWTTGGARACGSFHRRRARASPTWTWRSPTVTPPAADWGSA